MDRPNLSAWACLGRTRKRTHHPHSAALDPPDLLRYQPEKDTLTLYPGVLLSYPNFLFRVEAGELQAFADALAGARDEADFTALVERFGLRRTETDFWQHIHAPQRYMERHEPVQAGILDINRYGNF